MNLVSVVLDRYQLLLKYRKTMWSYLSQSDIKPEWIVTRPKSYQWSIDEHIRHLLASEIRYIQQSLDGNIPQTPKAVAAQWVGNVFFRFKEDEHVELAELKELFPTVEEKSLELLKNITEKELEMDVEAPWREKMSYYNLLEHFFVHENYHRGQVHFLITYYRGPPKFNEK